MLVVVTFAIDKRLELVEAVRMGKIREPLSLPLRNLLLHTQCGDCYRLSLLTVMRTGWLVAKVGGSEGDPWDFFPWPKCTAFKDFTATKL